MTNPESTDSSKLVKKDEVFMVKAELETEPSKAQAVVLVLLIGVMVTLTAVAGYLLLKKVTLTP